MKLHPLNTPTGKYVRSEATDIRKTFRAARKRIVRDLELKRRKELKQLKELK